MVHSPIATLSFTEHWQLARNSGQRHTKRQPEILQAHQREHECSKDAPR